MQAIFQDGFQTPTMLRMPGLPGDGSAHDRELVDLVEHFLDFFHGRLGIQRDSDLEFELVFDEAVTAPVGRCISAWTIALESLEYFFHASMMGIGFSTMRWSSIRHPS